MSSKQPKTDAPNPSQERRKAFSDYDVRRICRTVIAEKLSNMTLAEFTKLTKKVFLLDKKVGVPLSDKQIASLYKKE